MFGRQRICAIAGDKDKGDTAPSQYVRNRVNSLARQIDVEHRDITGLAARHIKRLRKSRNWPSHDASGRLQHLFHQSRDEVFVFDDQYFDSLERLCHEAASSIIARSGDDAKMSFSGFAGMTILQCRLPSAVSSVASPYNSKRTPRWISS